MQKLFTLLLLCSVAMCAWCQSQTVYEWKDNCVAIRTSESFDSLTFSLPSDAFVFTTGNPSALTETSMSATFKLTTSLSISNASSVTEQGVCYSFKESEPTVADRRVSRGAMTSGSWKAELTNLRSGMLYYYRPYLRVGDAVFYGITKSFTTLGEYVEVPGPGDVVDLGLSVKWAGCNVGAEFPGEYGDYFAWGETKPKSSYTSSNSITCGLSISELKSRGIIGADGNLTAAYDAATANWGGDWRMPTLDEMEELKNNCAWEWTTEDGVYGRKVTGPNGNSIFFPAAGDCGDASLGGAGSLGYYWSATPYGNSYYAYGLFFDSDVYWLGYSDRYDGQSVRPVYGATVTTGDASAITANSATLGGTVRGSSKSVTCGIIYGTSSTLSSTSGTKKSTTSSGSFSVDVTDLSPSTTYYYRAYVVVDGEYKYGDVLSFTTEALPLTAGEAIDLGLSVKWASCNVGATSPEEYGLYFSWGDTSPEKSFTSANCFTYDKTISELEYSGIINSDGNLTARYDAATANWDGDWRMPTSDEMDELINNCKWEWTAIIRGDEMKQDTIKGYTVTGSNGNSIFLPAAGSYYRTTRSNAGSIGYYWSATTSNDKTAFFLNLSETGCERKDQRPHHGFTVRPVKEQ